MGRLIEYQERDKGQLGPVVLVEVMPAGDCVHGIRWVGRLPCPRCGLPCQQWWCGAGGCDGTVIDREHVCGDLTDWVIVTYRDGRTERRQR